MATASRKSLASRAGAAARKVVSRSSSAAKKAAAKAPATKAAATKAVAKKAPAKKAPAKKTAAKKAPAKKTAAKKAPAKKAPAKKAAVKKAPAKTAPAKTAPAKKVTVTQPSAKKSASRQAPAAAKTTAPTAQKAATKAPAKRSAPSSKLMVLETEDAWTKAELDGVRRQLSDDIQRLTGELVEVEGDLAGMIENSGEGAGNDQADVGSASFERDQEMVIVNNARDMLEQSQHALERIADGSYGQCENCGNPIGKNRLMAFPRATLCLSCKQREERR
jgi:RNA polymerase-binding protein DksA